MSAFGKVSVALLVISVFCAGSGFAVQRTLFATETRDGWATIYGVVAAVVAAALGFLSGVAAVIGGRKQHSVRVSEIVVTIINGLIVVILGLLR
jgi:hypothetical protein